MEIKDIRLEYTGHSGFLIKKKNKDNDFVIAIDPYNLGNISDKADLILITHSHYDHCSIKDIAILAKKGTVIVIPADAQSKITRIENVEMQVIEVGDEFNFDDVKVSAVPAYNIDKPFHPKSEGWFGYIIKMGETIVYHTGDSDNIPEMRNLTGYAKSGNTFIALLPVSGKYVMNAEEAAEVAGILNVSLAIPMHFGAGVAGSKEDALKFLELCENKGINAKILTRIG